MWTLWLYFFLNNVGLLQREVLYVVITLISDEMDRKAYQFYPTELNLNVNVQKKGKLFFLELVVKFALMRNGLYGSCFVLIYLFVIQKQLAAQDRNIS